MAKLDGKVAVITGATSGMALATARLFVAEGAHVYITGRRKDRLDAAVAEIGPAVSGVQGDAGNLDGSGPARRYRAGRARPGRRAVRQRRLGVLEEPLAAVTGTSFDEVFAVNVCGTLFTVQKLLPLLSDGASVVLNSTAGAAKGCPARRSTPPARRRYGRSRASGPRSWRRAASGST